ncbi:MAG: hypothetical protein A2Y89_03120 [Chloroflexi bacterium RBG_13_51_18]|nr:MAG: hypothetical protein A2Y89_03120 [Chloroflexi bacterium RBG_13_51_18]
MPTKVTQIGITRQVYYDTYANLPTTGVTIGDLGYATDRKTLYRWSGAAWVAITLYCGSGIAADIPAAAGLPDGSLYYATDTAVLQQVQSSAWVTITATYFSTQNVVTGTRALGTTYQNTTGRPMIVCVGVSIAAVSGGVSGVTDNATPPVTTVASMAGGNTDSGVVCISFLVLLGNYYKVNSGDTLQRWVEWY